MYRIHCLLFYCLWSSFLCAQDYDYKAHYYGLEDGLAGRLIQAVCQDREGFIWVGTDNGLHLYDGYAFTIYRSADSSIFHKSVQGIAQDDQGLLWLEYEEHIREHVPLAPCNLFDPKEGRSYSLQSYFGTALPFSEETILFIEKVEDALLIAASNGTIWRYANKRFEILLQMPRSDDRFVGIYYDVPRKRYWTLSHDHYLEAWENQRNLYKQQLEHHWLRQVVHFKEDGRLLLAAASTDRPAVLFSSPGNFDFAYFSVGGTIEPFQFEGVDTADVFFPSYASVIYWSEEQHFLTFRDRRIYIFDRNGKFIERSSPLIDKHLDLKGLFWDRNGLLWLLSSEGLVSIAIRPKKFSHYLHDKKYGSWANWTYAARNLLQDQTGHLHIAGHGPLFLLQPNQSLVEHPLNERIDSLRVAIEVRTDAPILALEQDGHSLYFADANGVVIRYDKDRDSLVAYQHDSLAYPNQGNLAQWAMHKDRNGTLWIGHNYGLSFLNETTQQLQVFAQNEAFRSKPIYSIHENEAGLWLLNKEGLFCWDGHELKRYAKNERGSQFLPAQYFSGLYEDAEGYFWIATRGDGLVRWHPETKRYKKWTQIQGLPHNTLYCILPDAQQRLWISTNKGITCFNLKEERFHNFASSDGLLTEEFNTTSATVLQDGRLAFGNMNGMTLFDPEEVLQSAYSSIPLVITKISRLKSSSGEWVRMKPAQQTVELNGHYPALRLEFSLLDYAAPETQQYAYRIIGYQDEWIHTQESDLQLAGLPYGAYQLEIKGQGSDGQWSTRKIVLSLSVPRPFYLRWPFALLVLTALISLIWLIFRWRLYQLEQSRNKLQQEVTLRTAQIEEDRKKISAQAEQLRSLDKMKNRFFANISHELRTPITLLLSPLHRLIKRQNGQDGEQHLLKVAHRNGTRLLHLVEEILDLSKLEAGKLEVELKPVLLRPFLRRIMANYESQALQQQLDYRLETTILEELCLDLDQKKVEKILNNLIANALKFTKVGESIILSARWAEKEGLYLSVKDTGQGIPAEDLPHVFERFYQAKAVNQPLQGGTGIGLSFSKELVEFMQGRIRAESKWGEGSQFSLFLPLKISKKAPHKLEKKINELSSESNKEKFAQELPSNRINTRVLLAEDNYDMRQLLVLLLGAHYELKVMRDGLAAWEWLNAHPKEVDLVVSDWMMPNLDGSQLLEKMRADKRFWRMPFILLTARAGEQDRLSGYRLGVDDYMTKPFNEEELIARIRNLLQRQAVWQQALEEETKEALQRGEVAPERAHFSAHELQAVDRVQEFILAHLNKSELSVDDLAEQAALSSRQLNRILKKITGFTANSFTRELRLQEARKLLEDKSFSTVSEVAFEVGFETHAYFSKVYKKRFGRLPSDYLNA